jgi:hypothetical protein
MDGSKQSAGKCQAGSDPKSQLVEFALMIPILALILFVICLYVFVPADYTTHRNASAVAGWSMSIAANATDSHRRWNGWQVLRSNKRGPVGDR